MAWSMRVLVVLVTLVGTKSKTPVSMKTLISLMKSDLSGGLYKIPSRIGLDLII